MSITHRNEPTDAFIASPTPVENDVPESSGVIDTYPSIASLLKEARSTLGVVIKQPKTSKGNAHHVVL